MPGGSAISALVAETGCFASLPRGKYASVLYAKFSYLHKYRSHLHIIRTMRIASTGTNSQTK